MGSVVLQRIFLIYRPVREGCKKSLLNVYPFFQDKQLSEYLIKYDDLAKNSHSAAQWVHTSARLKKVGPIQPDTVLTLKRDGPEHWGDYKVFI